MAGMSLNNPPTDNPAYVEFVKVHMENALGHDLLTTRLVDMTPETLVRIRRVREAAHAAWFTQLAVQPKYTELSELDRLLGFVPITDDMDVEFAFDAAPANART